MNTLTFVHYLAFILWLGTATGEIFLEILLTVTKDPHHQRAYIRLHRLMDLILEGPALLATAVTGLLLLNAKGYFTPEVIWPTWLVTKTACASVVLVINGMCIGFVLMRAHRANQTGVDTTPLAAPDVRFWHQLVLSTFLGVPFALVAIWNAANQIP